MHLSGVMPPPAASGVKVVLFSGTQRNAVDKAAETKIRAASTVVKAEWWYGPGTGQPLDVP